MAERRYPRDWQPRDEERFLRNEDRRYGRDRDDNRDDPDMRYAHGRYSGSEQADDRRRREGGRVHGARYRPGEGSHGGGMERREGPYPMGFGAADPARGAIGEKHFRGVGPRGYRPSDDRIHEDVCDRLTEDATLDASSIEVSVKDGEVTLSGTVTSRGDKRHAEDLAESVAGVRDVQNSLRVKDERGLDSISVLGKG